MNTNETGEPIFVVNIENELYGGFGEGMAKPLLLGCEFKVVGTGNSEAFLSHPKNGRPVVTFIHTISNAYKGMPLKPPCKIPGYIPRAEDPQIHYTSFKSPITHNYGVKLY